MIKLYIEKQTDLNNMFLLSAKLLYNSKCLSVFTDSTLDYGGNLFSQLLLNMYF